MKPIRLLAALSTFGLVAACVPQPKPTPPAQVRPTPTATPAPPPPPPSANWMDVPASTGDWYYRNEGARSQALFGGRDTEAEFILRCERGSSSIVLSRASESAAPVGMRIRTETAERVFTATPDGGALPYVATSLPARDRLFDAMALSKGRFAVEVAGAPTLYLPSWAEVSRVIEDCR